MSRGAGAVSALVGVRRRSNQSRFGPRVCRQYLMLERARRDGSARSGRGTSCRRLRGAPGGPSVVEDRHVLPVEPQSRLELVTADHAIAHRPRRGISAKHAASRRGV